MIDRVDRFASRYREIVDDYDAFTAALVRPPRNTFRVNTIKATIPEVVDRFGKAGLSLTPIPWYEEAFAVDSPDALSATLERFLGTIYIGEPASMLPPLVIAPELQAAEIVFDACAAPGSKTTQAAAIMRNRGTIVANDRSFGRIRALQFNIHKFGAINTIITNYELHRFPKITFDVIMLDAPCSSSGTVRKSPKLIDSWNLNVSLGYAERQMDLLLRTFDMLRPGGTLVYSTCSIAPEENEGVIDHLVRSRAARVVPLELPNFRFAPGVTEWNGREFSPGVIYCGRVWPHHNDTDGFFVAKVMSC